jgi:hypothetical protein
MKSFFKTLYGICYLLVQVVWFFVISLPAAIVLLVVVEIVSFSKPLIKTICQKITTR